MTTEAQALAFLESTMLDLTSTPSHLKAMLYGPSGVGKTVAAQAIAQFVTDENKIILFVDSGEGWVSLKNHEKLLRRTKRIQFENTAQLNTLVTAMEKMYGQFHKVGAIVLDEFSSMATTDLDAVTKHRAANDSTGTKDPDTPAQPDYNTSSHRVRKVLQDLVGLPIHVILTAHEREDKGNNGIVKTRPLFTPKLGQGIRNALHLVAYLSISDRQAMDAAGQAITQTVRNFQVHPTIKIDAKSRIGGLNTVVDRTTLEDKVKEWIGGNLPTVPDKLVDTVIQDTDLGGFPPETEEK